MTRLAFDVSASSFIANMAVKQNTINFAQHYHLAAQAVHRFFYMDDGLTSADSIKDAIKLQQQLQQLFSRGRFFLCKWKCNEPKVLEHMPLHLLDALNSQHIPDQDGFAKTLGVEWSVQLNCFRLSKSFLESQC